MMNPHDRTRLLIVSCFFFIRLNQQDGFWGVILGGAGIVALVMFLRSEDEV